MKKMIASIFLALALSGSLVGASVRPPQEVVQETSARMIDALRQNSAALRQDSSRIYELVDQIVLPNFDFELMSRWVLGRAWQQATPDQRRIEHVDQVGDRHAQRLRRLQGKSLRHYASFNSPSHLTAEFI